MEQVALALEIIKYPLRRMCVYPLPGKITFLANLNQLQILLFPPSGGLLRTSSTSFAVSPTSRKRRHQILLVLAKQSTPTRRPRRFTALLKGTLFQESYVRNSCLQTLQVGLTFLAYMFFLTKSPAV